MKITYDNFCIPEPELINIRKQLYGSEMPGYFIIKNFIPQNFTNHMREFWSKEGFDPKCFSSIEDVDKSKLFYYGCPNYYYKTPYGHAFYNYFWNNPIDEVAHTVSFAVNYLRNIAEGSRNYNFYFPIQGNSCSYRMVFTKNGDKIVKPHTDWLEGGDFVPARLQATLILSKNGVDYSGEGMKMESNNKKETFIFGKNVDIDPGDLLLWRYNNLHSVENVQTTPDQLGFLRIIYPPEFLYEYPKEKLIKRFYSKELLAELKTRTKNRIKKLVK